MGPWLYLFPSIFWLLFNFQPEKPITLCGNMNQWAADPQFQQAHPAPLPYQGVDFLGKKVKFKTPDGKEASGYLIASKSKSDQWLFVYQEWWGLNDYIKAESDKFYKDLGGNVNVLALDMYDGQVTADPQVAGKLMQETKEDRLKAIILGGRDFAGEKAQIANVGWCFGGSLSLKSALYLKKQNIGSVIYYGMPISDMEILKTLNSDVLGLFATEQWISKEVIETFDASMKKAGKSLDYTIYPGVHGFANPGNPKYDRENAEKAYAKALKYLKGKFNI